MLTIEQIEGLHQRFGGAATLFDYVQSLAALGVVSYASFLSDGHSEYLGRDGQRVISEPAHEVYSVAEKSDAGKLLDHLRRHEDGETNYLQMSRRLAESGVERWTVETREMTMAFSDRSGEVLLVEQISKEQEPRKPLPPGGR